MAKKKKTGIWKVVAAVAGAAGALWWWRRKPSKKKAPSITEPDVEPEAPPTTTDWDAYLAQLSAQTGTPLTRIDSGLVPLEGGECHWLIAASDPPTEAGAYVGLAICLPAGDDFEVWGSTVQAVHDGLTAALGGIPEGELVPVPVPPGTDFESAFPPPEANYRPADFETGRACENCFYAVPYEPHGAVEGNPPKVRCTLWNVDVFAHYICDRWRTRKQPGLAG